MFDLRPISRTTLLIILIGLCGALAAYIPRGPLGDLIAQLENQALDFRQARRIDLDGLAKRRSVDIVIVNLDQHTIDRMGYWGRWPRSRYAEVIEFIRASGARAIGMDILFSALPGAVQDPDDAVFAEAIQRAGNVYLGIMLSRASQTVRPRTQWDPVSRSYQWDPYVSISPQSLLNDAWMENRGLLFDQAVIEGPPAVLAQAARALAFVTISPDEDGVNRSLPLVMHFKTPDMATVLEDASFDQSIHAYGSLGLRTAMHALGVAPEDLRIAPGSHIDLGGRAVVPIDIYGRMRLRYYGYGGPYADVFPYISFYDIWSEEARARLPEGLFKDKIVLIGSATLGDRQGSPFSVPYPGVELHATAIRNILHDDALPVSPAFTPLGLTILFGLLAAGLMVTQRLAYGLLWCMTLMAVYFAVGVYAYVAWGALIDIARPEATVALIAVGCSSYRVYRWRSSHRRELTRMRQELQLARDLQTSLLPDAAPGMPGFRVTGLSLPAYEVSGDYYGYTQQEGGRLVIIVADVSGKGMEAAMKGMRFSELLYHETRSPATPSEILAGLNRAMVGRFGRRTFITACAAVLDADTSTLTVAGAGHPQPFIRRADGHMEEIDAAGLPLGVRAKAAYNDITVSLQTGDTVYFYSDGLYEATDEQGEPFGFERLYDILKTPGRAPEEIMTDIRTFTGRDIQEDDMTLVKLTAD